MMSLAALIISLNIGFHPVHGMTNWQLDVTPTLLIELNVMACPQRGKPFCGIALPHAILLNGPKQAPGWSRNPTPGSVPAQLVEHELQHARQYEHLGPGFLIAYPMMPMAFDDYLSHPDPPWRGTDLNCPFLTITNASSAFRRWRFATRHRFSRKLLPHQLVRGILWLPPKGYHRAVALLGRSVLRNPRV